MASEKKKKVQTAAGGFDVMQYIGRPPEITPTRSSPEPAPGPADEKKEPEDSLTGTVESVIYRSEDTGYQVINFMTDDGTLISAVGILPGVSEGEKLKLRGKWEVSAKYGKQYRIELFETVIPTETAEIERYLASGAVKGIGPKTARKIIETFGPDTVDVMENHPDWLAQIPGITLKRAREMCEEFTSKTDVRAAVTFFGGYFGPAATMKIYRQYGSHSIDIAKENPYRICSEVDGIGFEKVDAMALKMGVDRESAERLCAGVRYVLTFNSVQNGHTCLPQDKLTGAAVQGLGASPEKITEAIRVELSQRGLVSESAADRACPYIYDARIYDSEKYIADKLLLLCRGGVPLDFSDIEGFIYKEEAENGIRYADEQKKAIFDALTSGVLVLTGGPGTGKTTIVTALIGIFDSLDMKVGLCAPTGRAAKRMTEATGREAKTVHRLLEVDFDGAENKDAAGGGASSGTSGTELKFRRCETNLLDERVLIIDEASMLDTQLTASLLKAVRPGARVIFIGDADQLPSVGAGNVLTDLIDSGCLPTVRLNQIFRQAGESLIVTNAHAINRGEMPRLDVKDRDFFFMPRPGDRLIAETVAQLCAERLPKAYGSGEIVQVITPTRKGAAGTEHLNAVLQEKINPPSPGKKEHSHRDRVFRVGDKVMQVRNNYELEWSRGARTGQGIFNGDIGRVTGISPTGKFLDIDFDGRQVMYDYADLDDLELAYAVTVHKSQGSEYSTVVLPLGDVPQSLRTRNLLYTAVTRAQKRVIIVGSADTVAEMVRNKRTAMRYTGLCRRLRHAFGKDREPS